MWLALNPISQEALLLHRDLATCISVEILQLQNIAFENGADEAGQSGTASDTDNSQSLHAADVKVNELLSYVTFYRDRISLESMHKVLVGFYTAGEITIAKKLLVSSFATSLTGCPLKADRRLSLIHISEPTRPY